MPQMCEKTTIDEKGRVYIPPIIRARTDWPEKTDVTVTVYGNKLIIENFISSDKLEDSIKKMQAALKLEESLKIIHTKNFDVSDEGITSEINEYRKTKYKTWQAG